ncbi:response regulator [Vibrio metoecus]|uniref:HDOD domain-containing protein n=1 Tax=Vibrio metoecus TaxID=1481663 RepID=UPI0006D7F066|nr:HDOD domain-containing protein [Vibrio metoecus]KQB07840.1 chemotaxis protein CheY [Vibrio metoecus]PAR51217.1 response regulator [Vibrio metoecus]
MTTEIMKVVCVDDDDFMLKALGRMIRRMRPSWEVVLVEDATQWVVNTDDPPSVVISDLLMPGKNGETLLTEVRSRSPQTLRVLLTGDTTQELPKKAHTYAQFVLPKPFTHEDFEHLFLCMERLYQMPFNNECRRRLGALEEIPILPNSVRKLQQVISSPNCSMDEIAETIVHEPVLTAKIIQIANSSYFGFRRNTDSLHEAVARLGAVLVESIAISLLAIHPSNPNCMADHQWVADCAFKSSSIARALVKMLGYSRQDQDRIFVANLLTSIGKILLLEDGASKKEFVDFYQLQPGYADCDVISAYILIMWGYDIGIGDIILNQRLTTFSGEHLEQLGSLSCLANQIENCRQINDYRQLVQKTPESIQGVLKELEEQFFPD